MLPLGLKKCSDADARWCRVHGACLCVAWTPTGGRVWDVVGIADECPLHGPSREHPLPPPVIKRRRVLIAPW